jgi:hypothetical protein
MKRWRKPCGTQRRLRLASLADTASRSEAGTLHDALMLKNKEIDRLMENSVLMR